MEPPLLVGLGVVARTEAICAGGPPLGMMPDWQMESEQGTTTLLWEKDTVLLLYTDGLTEIRNKTELELQLYGWERIRQTAERSAQAAVSPQQMSDAILADALAFSGGRQSDDICLLSAIRI